MNSFKSLLHSADKIKDAPPLYNTTSSTSTSYLPDLGKKTALATPQDENIFTASSSSSSHTRLACVSLHMTDRIRFLNFHPNDIRFLTDIVRANAVKGVKNVRLYDQATEIKLNGYPWQRRSALSRNGVGVMRLMMAILNGLHQLGWVVHISTDIWRKGDLEKDTLIMRQISSNKLPLPPISHWLSISFDSSDLLYIIDAPPGLGPALAAKFGDKVNSHTAHTTTDDDGGGEDEEEVMKEAGRAGCHYKIKFHGFPWRPAGTESVKSRLIILQLLEGLEEFGFRLYTAIEQGDTQRHGSDTWYCYREEGYESGMAVY